MKILLGCLLGCTLLLQMKLWVGEGSILHVRTLKQEVALQEAKVATLKARNQTLEAEVQDLKYRLGAIEERARTGLGMIQQGEIFYQYSPQDKQN